MIEVRFYNFVEDQQLKFAVVVAKYKGKWVFCRHRERDTYEIPGGHREAGEKILETAKRELYEETGAQEYRISPVCAYSVVQKDVSCDEETFGALFHADIASLGPLPPSEICEVILTDMLPAKLTYPLIQPKLIEKVVEILSENR